MNGFITYLATVVDLLWHARNDKKSEQGSTTSTSSSGITCSADGAPPMPTVEPVTIKPYIKQGRILSFEQAGITRYACFNPPQQAEEAQGRSAGYRWPLFIYLHGSRATPDSLYTLGKHLFALHNSYPLSDNPNVRGFFLLSPEGRRATPWESPTGTGFHWDEWYRNPSSNLDVQAVDHFLDKVTAAEPIDPQRIYVFGWSNGAYTAALYGVWRSHRIAAIGQYAGADPWSRTPCPVPMPTEHPVPLVLLRNLCDALVPCATTSDWIKTLTEKNWPFEYHNLGLRGEITADTNCAQNCGKVRGIFEHVRWPNKQALEIMLRFMKEHPLR
jgi:predicted esterase